MRKTMLIAGILLAGIFSSHSSFAQPQGCALPNVALSVETEALTQLQAISNIPVGTYVKFEAHMQKSTASCAANLGFEMEMPDGGHLMSISVSDNRFVCIPTSAHIDCVAYQISDSQDYSVTIVLGISTGEIEKPEIDSAFSLIQLPSGGDANPDDNIVDNHVKLTGLCGNGIQESFEECEDGNVETGDGCDANCALESKDEVEPPAAVSDDANQGANMDSSSAAGGCRLATSSNFSTGQGVYSAAFLILTMLLAGLRRAHR